MGIEPSRSDLAGSIDMTAHTAANQRLELAVPREAMEEQTWTASRPQSQPDLQPPPPVPCPLWAAENIKQKGFASSLENAGEGKGWKSPHIISKPLHALQQLRNVYNVKRDDEHFEPGMPQDRFKHVTSTFLFNVLTEYETVYIDFRSRRCRAAPIGLATGGSIPKRKRWPSYF
jgi:hypothetical protein